MSCADDFVIHCSTRSGVSGDQPENEREEKQQILSKKKSVLKKQLVTLRESWEYMTSAEKRNIVLACVDKVVIKDDDVQFFYTID